MTASYWIQNYHENKSVERFKALIENGQGLNEAKASVERGLNSQNFGLHAASLKLQNTLVDKGLCIE